MAASFGASENRRYEYLKGEYQMNAKAIPGIIQGICLIVGSVLFGVEFGWRIGMAVWFVGCALKPFAQWSVWR